MLITITCHILKENHPRVASYLRNVSRVIYLVQDGRVAWEGEWSPVNNSPSSQTLLYIRMKKGCVIACWWWHPLLFLQMCVCNLICWSFLIFCFNIFYNYQKAFFKQLCLKPWQRPFLGVLAWWELYISVNWCWRYFYFYVYKSKTKKIFYSGVKNKISFNVCVSLSSFAYTHLFSASNICVSIRTQNTVRI